VRHHRCGDDAADLNLFFTTEILVRCTGNSCRGQIAHGYLEYFGNNQQEVFSAGIETHGVNPRAIAIMKEDGVDIPHHTSNNVNEYSDIEFNFVLTVVTMRTKIVLTFLQK
jgi:arsenate reductase